MISGSLPDAAAMYICTVHTDIYIYIYCFVLHVHIYIYTYIYVCIPIYLSIYLSARLSSYPVSVQPIGELQAAKSRRPVAEKSLLLN